MAKITRYKIQYCNNFTGDQTNIQIYAYNLEQLVHEFREYFPKHTYRIIAIYKEVASDIVFNL